MSKGILLIFNDFDQLTMFKIPAGSQFQELAIKANGCYVNGNSDEFDEKVVNFICDLSVVVYALNNDEPIELDSLIDKNNANLEHRLYEYSIDSPIESDGISICGFYP